MSFVFQNQIFFLDKVDQWNTATKSNECTFYVLVTRFWYIQSLVMVTTKVAWQHQMYYQLSRRQFPYNCTVDGTLVLCMWSWTNNKRSSRVDSNTFIEKI